MNDLTQQISNAIIEASMQSEMILHGTKTIVVIRDTARQTLYANTGFDKPFDTNRENDVHTTGKPAVCIEKIRIDNDSTAYLTIYFPVKNDDEITGVGMIGIPVADHGRHETKEEAPFSDDLDKPDYHAGMLNPAFIMASLQKEILRSEQNDLPTTVVLMNIDKFAKMNEEWGQTATKTILDEFCKLIKSHLRSSDLLGRWGEKEFILLLPDTSLVTGKQIADRIRIAIEHRQFDTVGQITASFGIATHQKNESLEDFIKRVDAAVFSAKVSGKNRVELKAGHFLKLVWRQEYECGNAIIDDQHRKLFFLANKLLYAIFDNKPKKQISPLIQQLLEHIQKHFDEEERILASAGYAKIEEHARIHCQLVQKAIRLAARFEKNELDFGEIFSFLANDVVIEHMQREDRKFFSFLSQLHI